MKLLVTTLLLIVVLVIAGKIDKNADRNLYDKIEGSSKAQHDSAGNKYFALDEKSLRDDASYENKKEAQDEYVDRERASDKLVDDYSANRNKKSWVNDDLDKNFDALRYNKRNTNGENAQKRTSFYQDSFAQDGAPEVTDARLHKNYLKKQNGDYQRQNSLAGHKEATIRENHSSGFGKGPVMHQSINKHEQNHKFGNDNENAWNDKLDKNNLDESKQISLSIAKKKTKYDDLDQYQKRDDNYLDFANQNQKAKKRFSQGDEVDEDLKRNKAANKDLDKSRLNSRKLILIKNDDRSRAAAEKQNAQKSDNVNHDYDENDYRNKKITRDQY